MNTTGFPGQTLAPIPLSSASVTPSAADSGDTLLQKIAQLLYNASAAAPSVVNVNGFYIPYFTEIDFTYYGSTNNIHTQVFKNGSTTVATLTYTYVGGGSSNDDLILAIVLS